MLFYCCDFVLLASTCSLECLQQLAVTNMTGPSRRPPLVWPFVNGENKTDVVLLLAVLWRRVNRKLQQRTKKKKKYRVAV